MKHCFELEMSSSKINKIKIKLILSLPIFFFVTSFISDFLCECHFQDFSHIRISLVP